MCNVVYPTPIFRGIEGVKLPLQKFPSRKIE
nr:MAG TPA: hypothetical protein [Bacteriophage sp.]